MPWVRRTRHLALSAFEGDDPRVVVRSLLAGKQTELSMSQLGALLRLPIRSWTWFAEDDPWAEELGRAGLVISDDPEKPFASLRQQDEELTALGWWPDAAALHRGARWDGARARVPGRDGSPATARSYLGLPLPAFPVRGGSRMSLPRSEAESPLRQLLARRRTVRTFDDTPPVDLTELATLLRWVWGAHGTTRLAGNDVGLRRTSAGGGAPHPIEVYPAVMRVDGISPGVYPCLGGDLARGLVAP